MEIDKLSFKELLRLLYELEKESDINEKDNS